MKKQRDLGLFGTILSAAFAEHCLKRRTAIPRQQRLPHSERQSLKYTMFHAYLGDNIAPSRAEDPSHTVRTLLMVPCLVRRLSGVVRNMAASPDRTICDQWPTAGDL